jgi:hypothetical protein
MTVPELSFIIATPDCFERIRLTVEHMAAQAIRDQIEIVIVAPSAAGLRPDEAALAMFHGWQVVEVGPLRSSARARAAGIVQARAPVVALGEDHSYPQPGWAEALLAAHKGPWAAVGPAICNANPASSASWANFLIDYGQWMHPAQSGEREHLPGHNSSFKREALLPYGPRLAEMLEAESVLHWDLRARGHRLYLAAEAQTHHLNPSRLWPWLPNRFRGGRIFAGSRAHGWPLRRRLVYAAGAFALPLRGLRHQLRLIRAAGLTRQLVPWVLPPLLLALAVDGAGRVAGYSLGSAPKDPEDLTLEFQRHSFLNSRDRQTEARRQAAFVNPHPGGAQHD